MSGGCTSLCSLLVLTSVAASHASVGVCASEYTSRRVFLLRPGLPAITQPSLPPLHQPVLDADRSEDATLSIEPERPCRWVFSPGEQVVFTVGAPHSKAIDGLLLTAWDWEGRPVATTHLTPPVKARLLCKVEGRGAYVLTLDGFRGSECALRLVRSFSVCPPNDGRRAEWRRNGFWIGQCSFPGWQDYRSPDSGHSAHPDPLTADQSMQLDAELVARMGVRVARINLPVNRSATGAKLDFRQADKCVNAFVSRGLSLDLQLFGPDAGPSASEEYRSFVSQVVKRYGKHAMFVQVGNEPGNEQQYAGKADDYIRQFEAAAAESRRARPGTAVTNGGYCFTNQTVQRIVRAIRSGPDFVSYHWHGDLPGLKAFRAEVAEMHREAGYTNPSFANTEMGYAMPTVADESTNAATVMQKLLYCWAHGDRGVLLYSSRELWWPRQYSYGGVSDYGFVDHFFCPRFVYGAASALIDHYAGFRFERILHESDNLHCYAFTNGSKRLVALSAASTPVKATLRTDARSARLIDAMGNETDVKARPSITLQAVRYPQSVLLDGANTIAIDE